MHRAMTFTLLQVALGGALGATSRYLTGLATIRLIGAGFPWGTLTVNVVGSFLMGVIVVVLAQTGGNRYAPLLMTGFLGGFTTFSAFSLDAVTLVRKRSRGAGGGAMCWPRWSCRLLALMAGLWVARGMMA